MQHEVKKNRYILLAPQLFLLAFFTTPPLGRSRRQLTLFLAGGGVSSKVGTAAFSLIRYENDTVKFTESFPGEELLVDSADDAEREKLCS
jgi:hypothetical protein